MSSRRDNAAGVLVVALLLALVVVVVAAPQARWLQLALVVPFVLLIVSAVRKPGSRVSVGKWDTPPERSYRVAKLLRMNPPKPPPGHRGPLEWAIPEEGEEPVAIPVDTRALELLHLRVLPIAMIVFLLGFALVIWLVFPADHWMRYALGGFVLLLVVNVFSRMLTPPRWEQRGPGGD